MTSFAPASLARWTGGYWTSEPTQPLAGFTQDTRQLRTGQVFVALQTDKRDGHDFLTAAANASASAALVSKLNPSIALPQLVVADALAAFQTIAREHRRLFQGPVVGISGSCGKTSTKNLLARLLGGDTRVLATEGNLNNHIGVPLTLTRLDSRMHEFAVVEAGISRPGDMVVLAQTIRPSHGIITNVAPAHTEELGGIAGVAREKSLLLHHVQTGGLAVFPKQCWEYACFQDLDATTVVVAPEGEPVVAPRVVHFGVDSTAETTRLTISGNRCFQFSRMSRGMAQNAALAILLASELGASDDAIQKALHEWRPAKWRGEFRRDGERLLYLDFYNANPASMADALENFFSIVPAELPRLFVLGCMEELGPESPRYHRELGRTLQLRSGDYAFVIGSEAAAVVAGAIEAGVPAERIENVDSLSPVAARVAGFAGAVFVKGSRRYELEKALPASGEPPKAGYSGGGGGRGASATAFAAGDLLPPTSTAWRFPQMAARSERPSVSPFR